MPENDPYDQPESWFATHRKETAALAVFVLTALLTVLCFPPHRMPQFAYGFAVPAIFWAYRRPNFRLYAAVVIGANMVAWTIVLGWLHHVSWLALLLLGPIVGAWVGSWFLAVHWAMPRFLGRNLLGRLGGMLGLAGLWVLIEWTRTWFLSGFPWLPLSASQYEQVSILQISAFTGGWGVSFVLICVNIGFAAYGHRLLCEGVKGLRRRSQEFFACLFLLLVCVAIHVQEVFNRGRFLMNAGRVVVVQPAIPQEQKWDAKDVETVIGQLEKSTHEAAKNLPDLIIWPEASTPMAVLGDERARAWVEGLAKRNHTPILLGSIGVVPGENSGDPDIWRNAAFVVDHEEGLLPVWYSKRHLVPFGEYVPLRPVLGWLNKIVPIGDSDFSPGESAQSLLVKLRGQPTTLGPLICYEDTFPSLARNSTLAGAEFLVVLTNMAWYHESAAARQQLAHSVLRAVENRRPVIRCGNTGWSGWIDEFGNIRQELSAGDKGIFVRANMVLTLQKDSRWVGRNSMYVEYGDWFVLTSLGLAILAWLLLRRDVPPVTEPAAGTAEGEEAR